MENGMTKMSQQKLGSSCCEPTDVTKKRKQLFYLKRRQYGESKKREKKKQDKQRGQSGHSYSCWNNFNNNAAIKHDCCIAF